MTTFFWDTRSSAWLLFAWLLKQLAGHWFFCWWNILRRFYCSSYFHNHLIDSFFSRWLPMAVIWVLQPMTLSPTSFPPINSSFACAPFTLFPSPLPIYLFRPFLHFHMLVVSPHTFPFPFCPFLSPPFPICFLSNSLCFFLLVHRQKLIKGLSVHDFIFADIIFMEYCFF